MSQSIRISDELVAEAKAAAKLYHRSPQQQIEHWAQLGRILEPALSYQAAAAAKRISRSDVDAILSEVETSAGAARGQSVIREASGSIASTD